MNERRGEHADHSSNALLDGDTAAHDELLGRIERRELNDRQAQTAAGSATDLAVLGALARTDSALELQVTLAQRVLPRTERAQLDALQVFAGVANDRLPGVVGERVAAGLVGHDATAWLAAHAPSRIAASPEVHPDVALQLQRCDAPASLTAVYAAFGHPQFADHPQADELIGQVVLRLLTASIQFLDQADLTRLPNVRACPPTVFAAVVAVGAARAAHHGSVHELAEHGTEAALEPVVAAANRAARSGERRQELTAELVVSFLARNSRVSDRQLASLPAFQHGEFPQRFLVAHHAGRAKLARRQFDAANGKEQDALVERLAHSGDAGGAPLPDWLGPHLEALVAPGRHTTRPTSERR